MADIVGSSFTAVTVTGTGSASVLPVPSEATRLICVLPFWLSAGVTIRVQVPAGPPTNEMPEAGTKVVFAEVATNVRLLAGVSPSVTVIVTGLLGVSSNVVMGSEILITG